MQKRFAPILLLALCLLTVLPLQAQDYPRPQLDFELLVQELFGQQDDANVDYEDLYETLLLYYQQPLDLNRATREELSALFVLTQPQISALLRHRQRHGPLLSIYELQSIEGFDLLTIYKLLPFATVPDAGLQADRRPLLERIIGEDNNSLIIRYERTVQQRRGFAIPDTSSRSRYLGSPDKFFARYRISHTRDFSLGFTLEKDPGEQFIWDPQTYRYGIDFFSAHFQLYDKGRFRAIALGDYQLQFGQGLLLSSGFAVGKGSETITTVRRSNIGIRPYSSVLESQFYRGAAVTYLLSKRLELTGFVSRKRLDASLQTAADTLEPEEFFSSVQTSGNHRTATEIANKHRVGEQIFGGNLGYTNASRTLQLGLTVLQTDYDKNLQPAPLPYKAIDFNGRRNLNAGFHYSYTWQNFSFFGEAARSTGGGFGAVNGLMASLTQKVELSLLYRHYQPDFYSFYGNAFSEGTRNVNERGWYTGLRIRPMRRWEITAFYDRFTFPWLRYRVDAPSGGDEYLLRLLFQPSRLATLYAQFRTETKERNDPAPRAIDFTSTTLRRQYLVFYDFTPTRRLNLRSRVQFSSFRQGEGARSTGYLIAQDVSYDFGRIRLSTRYAIFDTDNFDTRQYAMEKDVLYAFSVPAFHGRGTRIYGILQLKASRRFDLWLRCAHTHYRDRSTVGSGLDEIEGPQRTDLKTQVRYKF